MSDQRIDYLIDLILQKIDNVGGNNTPVLFPMTFLEMFGLLQICLLESSHCQDNPEVESFWKETSLRFYTYLIKTIDGMKPLLDELIQLYASEEQTSDRVEELTPSTEELTPSTDTDELDLPY